jgi:hypothetical protein
MTQPSRIGDELTHMEHEPFLEVEKKLVGWSLITGLVLLVVLVWISYRFFPPQ